MISPIFIDNWLKILKFNARMDILEKSELKKEIVRIPLTPLKIKASILYYLFELLYPNFINDQQNILDIILSDDGNEIIKLILYNTKNVGIHESFQVLSNDIIDFQLKFSRDLDDFDEQFSKIQVSLIKKTGIRISSIRLFKNTAIDTINQYCVDLENISFYEFLHRITDLLQYLFEHDLFYIYPQPNIHKFIKESIKLLNGIKLSKYFEFLNEIFMEFNTVFVFNSKKLILILKLTKLKPDSEIMVNILTPEDLLIDANKVSIEEMLAVIQNRLKSSNVYLINQNSLMSILLDIFELDIPIEAEKIQLLLQKVLFGLRSFENLWYMSPRPKVYNSFNRFLVRFFGLNLNFKKISHWAIPNLILNSLDSNFGLNYKILIVITSSSRRNKKSADYLNYAFKDAVLLEVENRKLVNIIPINKNELISDKMINTLQLIRQNISEKFGFVSAVMNIDKSLLNNVIGSFGIKLSKYRPLSKSKAYRMLKKEKYFNIYPEMPFHKMIKDRGMLSLLRLILPILIDKHEF